MRRHQQPTRHQRKEFADGRKASPAPPKPPSVLKAPVSPAGAFPLRPCHNRELISLPQRRGGRYSLTVDEFRSWQESIDQYGLGGLRIKRIQQYRPGHWRRAWW